MTNKDPNQNGQPQPALTVAERAAKYRQAIAERSIAEDLQVRRLNIVADTTSFIINNAIASIEKEEQKKVDVTDEVATDVGMKVVEVVNALEKIHVLDHLAERAGTSEIERKEERVAEFAQKRSVEVEALFAARNELSEQLKTSFQALDDQSRENLLDLVLQSISYQIDQRRRHTSSVPKR